MPQDEFILNNITENDTLVVSVGGNDIALKPIALTGINMVCLTRCMPTCCVKYFTCGCAPLCCPWDCGHPGCLGCLQCCCACPVGAGYFFDMFKNRITRFVKSITAKRK